MNVVHNKSLDEGRIPEIDANAISDLSDDAQEVINKAHSQSKELLDKNQKIANEDKIPEAIDDKILKSKYFPTVNKVYRDLQDRLIEHGVDPLDSEKKVLLDSSHKSGCVTILESSNKFSQLTPLALVKVIIRYITRDLPYIDHVKLSNVMGTSSSTYQGILLEIKIQKDKSQEHEKTIANRKSYREANELYEALHPIERRLAHIAAVINGLKEHKDLVAANKEIQSHLCTRIAEKNKDKIAAIFKKLKSDRNNLSELEKDQKIILSLEKEIVDAAKRSLGLYIQHMHVLYRDKFTKEEHTDFRNKLNSVKNSETLEQFRVKLFEKLVKLKIRKLKQRAKNHGVRQQKK